MLKIKDTGVEMRAWVDGVSFDENAKAQLLQVSRLPFVKGMAIMPDVHLGIGCSVGSVIATKGAVIPASVGVDIGCGMIAMKTNLTAKDLPDNLEELRKQIERDVPHGRTNNGRPGDRGAWFNVPLGIETIWDHIFKTKFDVILNKHPKLKGKNTYEHLGTLGTGNHFIEICLDQKQNVWIMLHSGSRGVGNRIGTYFIEQAKEDMVKQGITLENVDLAYLTSNTSLYNDYVEGVEWAQMFALWNRSLMMDLVITSMEKIIGLKVDIVEEAINCHHNYISQEVHFGEDLIVTRKGAVRAGFEEYGIIPGSMGARSFIVKGKGNPESYESCSHGAGRVMSRSKAKQLISLYQHIEDTAGIECKKDLSVIDESPRAYKDIDKVMKAQEDLVEIVEELNQVLVVKG